MAKDNKKSGRGEGSLLVKFFLRFLFIEIILMGTYNPFGFSYFHWVAGSGKIDWSQFWGGGQAFVGFLILLTIGLLFWWSLRSIGVIGKLVILIGFGLLGYMAVQKNLIDLNDPQVWIFASQQVLAFMLAIGSLFSKFQRRETGIGRTEDGDT